MRNVLKVLLLLVVPLAALELTVPHWLFEHVSYSNSASIDSQLKALGQRDDWNVLVIGDSEVRWGVSPTALDVALAQQGVRARSFNLAFDGFGGSLWAGMLPHLDLARLAPNLRVLMLGVQLIEGHSLIELDRHQPGVCGALQKPVLTSAFALDHGLARACRADDWKRPLIEGAELTSALVRYRQPLRALMLGSGGPLAMNSSGLEPHADGFQPHRSIAENRGEFEKDYQRFLADRQGNASAFEPLAEGVWPGLVRQGGYFDHWRRLAADRGLTLVLFAVPTNPMLIDAKNRRADYLRNSGLLSEWASVHQVPYVDLGIRDQVLRDEHFADHRHLSQYGAPAFSSALGELLGRSPGLRAALGAPPEQRAIVVERGGEP